jgi:mannosyl-3-phosphoglycerate phosphatase
MGLSTHLWVVTDLDGSLLDEADNCCDGAREALDALTAAGVRLVLASSKTRAEIEHLAPLVGAMPAAFIVENGGAIVIPSGFPGEDGAPSAGRTVVVELGLGRTVLLSHLAAIATETGAGVRGLAETASLTGLPEPLARLARDRHYDEPFLVNSPSAVPAIEAAANRRGLQITHGGRWHHLTGPTDKGAALEVLRQRFGAAGRPVTIGLGDAANDLSFLRIVDRPIVIPRSSGVDPALASSLPHAERAPAPGPPGWNAAILSVLAGRSLPRVSPRWR